MNKFLDVIAVLWVIAMVAALVALAAKFIFSWALQSRESAIATVVSAVVFLITTFAIARISKIKI